MTREEAIALMKRNADGYYPQMTEALNMAIKALEQEPKWISVSKRLPEKGKQVLCCNKQGRVFTSAVTHIEEYAYGYRYAHFGKHCGVVAWMPLPEPYKEGEE